MSAKDIEMMKKLGIIKEEKKEDKLEQIKNDKAYISNELVEAIFHNTNTLTAIKILFYIARIDIDNNIKKGKYHHIKLNKKEMMDYTKLTAKTLDRNLQNIQETTVTFYSDKDKSLFSRTSLISRAEYINTREILIDMHEDILKRINETREYTEINTLNIMKIKHKHSAKMIMLITMISKFDNNTKKQRKYNLEQLNYLFDVNYRSFYELEQKILLPVQKELDSNSSVSYKYDKSEDMLYTGKGRKPIKEIIIKPIIKQYIETTLDDMITAQDEYNKEPQQTAEDTYKMFAIDKFYLDKIENEFEMNPHEIMKEQRVFLDYCKKNNKSYKDMSRSLYLHIKGAKKQL